MKVWTTKHALTQGILQIEAEIDPAYPQSIQISRYSCVYGEGREWHRTKVAAKNKAERMRLAKIESLKTQIAKLKALRFEPLTVKDGVYYSPLPKPQKSIDELNREPERNTGSW